MQKKETQKVRRESNETQDERMTSGACIEKLRTMREVERAPFLVDRRRRLGSWSIDLGPEVNIDRHIYEMSSPSPNSPIVFAVGIPLERCHDAARRFTTSAHFHHNRY
jgi:hypothetical protein